MTVKFYNYNLVNQDSTVITPSNSNALFPVSNLKDDRRSKVFRSSSASVNIVFDFVTIEEVDSFVLVPHILNGFGFNAPITIEANATNTWGAPAFSTTIISSDIDHEHGIAIKELTTSESYRFWRLSFTGVSYVEISKIFIGKRQLIGTGKSIDYGWQFLELDNSIVSVNRYGQKFIDELPEQKRIQFAISNMNKDQIDDFFEVYDYNRKIKPFFFYISCNILNNNKRFSGYFYFEEKPAITNVFYSLYSTDAVISEGM